MSHMLLGILGMEGFCLMLLWGYILTWGYEEQQEWQAYLHRKHLRCRIIVGNKQMCGCLSPSCWSTLWTLSVLPKPGLLSEDKSKPQRVKGNQNPLLKDIYSEKHQFWVWWVAWKLKNKTFWFPPSKSQKRGKEGAKCKTLNRSLMILWQLNGCQWESEVS